VEEDYSKRANERCHYMDLLYGIHEVCSSSIINLVKRRDR